MKFCHGHDGPGFFLDPKLKSFAVLFSQRIEVLRRVAEVIDNGRGRGRSVRSNMGGRYTDGSTAYHDIYHWTASSVICLEKQLYRCI